jgi:hypothetical protein
MDLENQPELVDLEAIAGVRLAKALPLEQLETGLRAFMAKQAGSVTRVAYRDSTLLQVKEAEQDASTYVTVTGDSKILLIGAKKSLEGALDRYASGNKVSPARLFPASIGKAVGKNSLYVIVNPTAEMTAKLGQPNAGAPPNPAKALMGKLKSAGFGVNFAETMDLAIVSQFADAATAQQASMLTDAQAISGIKMFATMLTGGAPLPLLQTMKTGAGDTGIAWFKMSLSKADLDLMVKAAEQKMQQAVPEGMTPIE